MKAVLLVFLCALTLSSSAQFWKKKKAVVVVEEVAVRYEVPVTADADTAVWFKKEFVDLDIAIGTPAAPNVKDIEFAEDGVMKEAKHHMRYHEYAQASTSFTDLAILYLLQNRFSEAKWYLLQSNEISREQKDNKHTIANLIMLAQIKLSIGEPILAKADLQEAHDLANTNSMTDELATVEKALQKLDKTKSTPKAQLRYAEAVETKKKTK